MNTVDVSVIIPAYKRPRKLIDTLGRIGECDPRPREFLVYVDANNAEVLEALEDAPVEVKTLSSPDRLGPGGGRNLLIRDAKCPYVASFDDDSYPLHKDYFQRAFEVMEQVPNAAVVGATIFSEWREEVEAAPVITTSRKFYGCGCVYRKKIVQTLPGYVPLPLAYAMEETDLTLQALANGHDVMLTPWLQVYHDRESPKDDAEINFAMIRNSALLPFLRYPAIFFPAAILQWLRVIIVFLAHGRREGIGRAIRAVPSFLLAHRSHRKPLTLRQAIRFFTGRFKAAKELQLKVSPS